MLSKIQEAARYIIDRSDRTCYIGMILGSGLGRFANQIENSIDIEYKDIPNFPTSSVKGHKSLLKIGSLHGHPMAVMCGRVHYYEGFSPEKVIFPVRVLGHMGVKIIIITNAAGGISPEFSPGDLMLVRDHINFMGFNPLRGENREWLGPRFPDMTFAYSPELREIALKVASDTGIHLREGVYIAVSGPSYETPAEIKMFANWGADAVGMSTVPEVIAASHMGMKVLCLSCITNMAAGILKQPLTHSEVLETTARVEKNFTKLLSEIIKEVP